MLLFVDLSLSAIQQFPRVLDYIQSWLAPVVGEGKLLKEEEWFIKGHGIEGGSKDAHGIWIPRHAKNGRVYIWSPPPVIADLALEECMKAIHKRTDAIHVFMIPRLYSTLWSHMFYKVSYFVSHLVHGIGQNPCTNLSSLAFLFPLFSRSIWTLQRMPLLVGLERKLRQVLSTGETDGRYILCKLL